MAWDLVLNLQVIESLTLVQGIGVGGTSALSISDQVAALVVGVGAAWGHLLVLLIAVVAAIIVVWVAVRIVDEALLFKEVFAASFPLLVVIYSTGLERVVLDVDLATSGVVEIVLLVLLWLMSPEQV